MNNNGSKQASKHGRKSLSTFLVFADRLLLGFLFLICLETSFLYLDIPPFKYLFEGYYQGLIWFADAILNSALNLEIKFVREFNGSTDRIIDIFKYCFFFSLSSLWALFGKEVKYRRPVLAVIVFGLAIVQISYGLGKLMGMQFGPPSAFRWTEEVGNMTPMRLMWTFIGVSPLFKSFVGLSQAFAGALIVVPKTRLIGACLSFALFINIFVLNVAFDAPLKIFTLCMVLASIIVLVSCDNFKAFKESVIPKGVKWGRFEVGVVCCLVFLTVLSAPENMTNEKESRFYGEFRILRDIDPENIDRVVFGGGNTLKVLADGKGYYFSYQKGEQDHSIVGFEKVFKSHGSFFFEGNNLVLVWENRKVPFARKNEEQKLIRLPAKLIHEFPLNESESFKRRRFN